MLPLPLLTPMPGCWARLVSIVGCEGCEVEPLAPPDTPAPAHRSCPPARRQRWNRKGRLPAHLLTI